jgi:hypothetical protein
VECITPAQVALRGGHTRYQKFELQHLSTAVPPLSNYDSYSIPFKLYAILWHFLFRYFRRIWSRPTSGVCWVRLEYDCTLVNTQGSFIHRC